MTSKKILAIIIALGTLIRLAAEFMQPAFQDEAFIYFTSRSGWKMFEILIIEPHPPLWNIILYLPARFMEYNIGLLRLPSLFFSVLAIYAAYRIGTIFKNENIGLLLAALCATSYTIWQNDILLRPNAALSWSALAIIIMMAEILEQGKPKFGWPVFTAIATLCASVHYLGAAFVTICLFISITFKKFKIIAVCLIISLIPMCSWTLWCLNHNPAPRTYPPSHYLGISTLPADIMGIDKAIDVLFGINREESQESGTQTILKTEAPYAIASIPLWILMIAGAFSISKQNFRKGLLLAGPLLGIIVLLIAGSILGKGTFFNRYFVFLAIPAAMLISAGALETKGKLRKVSAIVLPSIIGANLLLCILFPFIPALWNQYWQGTIDFIESHKTEGDKICLYHPFTIMQFGLAYDPKSMKRCDFSSGVFTINRTPSPGKLEMYPIDIRSARNADYINELRQGRVFLVLLAERNNEFRQVMEALDAAFIPELKFHSQSYKFWASSDCYLLIPKEASSQP